jgi:hypothetical protein
MTEMGPRFRGNERQFVLRMAPRSGTRCREAFHHRVQSTAIDLAIRVARNVRNVDEPYGNMCLLEPLATVLLQSLLVEPAVRDDNRPDLVNAVPVRHAEHCRVADAIKRLERIFDDPRADLVAAEIEDLFFAPADNQHIFIGEIADIAGIEISVAEWRSWLLRIVKIALDADGRADAYRAFSICRHAVPGVVDDPAPANPLRA